MGNLDIRRTPDLIAAEINSIKDQTRNMVLYNSIEIGRRLVEAKELVPYGEWGEWLGKSVSYSKSTANNLMRIFQDYGAPQMTLLGDNAKSQALGNLSYTQAVALLGLPEDEREQFIEEHDLNSMSTRELQQAIKEKDEALKRLEEAKKTAIEKAGEVQKLQKEKQKVEAERDSLKDVQTSLKETEKELESSNKQIQELERQLKEKPIEAAVATVEKVPEDVEKELTELREKAKNGEVVAKFKVNFDILVKSFNELLGSLAEVHGSDSEIYEKYKNAVKSLIGKMSERL